MFKLLENRSNHLRQLPSLRLLTRSLQLHLPRYILGSLILLPFARTRGNQTDQKQQKADDKWKLQEAEELSKTNKLRSLLYNLY